MSMEEKILSTLDKISSELQELKQDVAIIKQTMVTKDDLHKVIADSQEDIKAMLSLVNEKLDEQDFKFAALNDRLFSQEAHIRRISKRDEL